MLRLKAATTAQSVWLSNKTLNKWSLMLGRVDEEAVHVSTEDAADQESKEAEVGQMSNTSEVDSFEFDFIDYLQS